ncbi:ABC transporter substrate-binding protein [Corynebacterium pseudogenitalium]|uniref:ABC transporter substrate-binding protein n=1 Tax=Corynebacterium pseudogenitalium TaxID=38303 RepID=A0ABD4TTD4_9CORY|nr:ABC transporter substrate-binding protein [Corynebacterium pseudogenitalium]MCQ4614529.1 ABC transporter substrate-binding protein [Corynebacterium pseudogenitalium]
MRAISAALGSVLVAGLALTGCSSADEQTPQAQSDSAITIDNCGTEVTVQGPVQRATTLEQGATDTLLLLGAKDQIAGYGHQKDLPPAGFSLDGLKEVSPSVPNSEQLRDADTDFIFSPFDENWRADAAGTREEWARLGVATFNPNSECPSYGDNKGKDSFQLIAKDLEDLGKLFGREEEAKKLIEKQNSELENAKQAPEGTTFMLLYSSVGGSPYVAGGPSIVTNMGERTGMTNVFANLDEEWPQVSWEAVAEADPDVIILADLPGRGEPGDKWEEKVADLEATPGTKEMKAVKNNMYIVVPGVATSASARSYEVVQNISKAIDDGLFDGATK